MSSSYDSVYWIASIIGALVVGFVFGLVPLIGGFAACLVGGFILGLILALPMCALFTVLIFVTKPKNAAAPYGQYPGQTPYPGPMQPNQPPVQPPVAQQPAPAPQQDAAPEKMPWENPEQK